MNFIPSLSPSMQMKPQLDVFQFLNNTGNDVIILCDISTSPYLEFRNYPFNVSYHFEDKTCVIIVCNNVDVKYLWTIKYY